jgi:hypothetical protein
MSKQDHRARDEARQLILQAVTQANSGLTRTQIANALERTKTPHLIDLIEELVDEGYLVRHVKVFGNGVEGYIYSPKP